MRKWRQKMHTLKQVKKRCIIQINMFSMKNVFRNNTFPFANLHFGDLLFMDAHHKYQIGINACNIQNKKISVAFFGFGNIDSQFTLFRRYFIHVIGLNIRFFVWDRILLLFFFCFFFYIALRSSSLHTITSPWRSKCCLHKMKNVLSIVQMLHQFSHSYLFTIKHMCILDAIWSHNTIIQSVASIL